MHLDGVFGYSQLRKLGAVIDCGRRNLYVNPWGPTKAASQELSKFALNRGYVRVPMRVNRYGHPEVPCRINGRSSILTVETAAFTTIIDKSVASRAGLSLTPTYEVSESVGHRKSPVSVGVANEFSVGGFEVQRVKVSVTDVSFNVLGIDFLSSQDAIIDVGGMNLFLRRAR
jgi:predicted aspartyl protease